MPALDDPLKELFATRVAAGATQMDAYLEAKPDSTPKTARNMASRWAKRQDIGARINELTRKATPERKKIARLATQRAADEVVELIEAVKADRQYVMTNLVEIVERCMQRAPVMEKVGAHTVQKQTVVSTPEGDRLANVWTFDAKGALGALKLIGLENQMFAKTVNLRTSLLDDLPPDVLKVLRAKLVTSLDNASVGRTIEDDRSLVDRPDSEG